jgi:hypothetical protein
MKFLQKKLKKCKTRAGSMINNFHSNENVPDSWARKGTKGKKTIPKEMKKMLALNSTISPMPHKRLYEKERRCDDKNCKRHTREGSRPHGKKENFPSRFTFDFSISLMKELESEKFDLEGNSC